MACLGQCARVLIVLLNGFSLLGCGLVVPDIKEVWDADKPADSQTPKIPGAAQIEFEVKKHIFCELEKAVKYVNRFPVSSGPSPNKLSPLAKYPIPLDWISQISLSFQVDESSALNPGVALITTLPNAVTTFAHGSSVTTGQSRMLGFGGTLSSTGTRIDKFDPSYTISYLMIPDGPNSVCRDGNDPFTKIGWKPDTSSPFILEGDLGIQDWLFGAILTDIFIGSQAGPAGGGGSGSQKPDTVSYEIKFVIVSSGNITPTWKLVNVSANTSGTFFSTGRTRTHDLIITIGPNDNRTLYSHLA